MAVDTQEKRMNAAKVGRPFLRSKLATGTFDEQARINCGLGYGANALSPGGGRIMGGLVGYGGLVGPNGGLIGQGGGIVA